MTLDEWLEKRRPPTKLFFASLSYAINSIKEFPCKLWMRHAMDIDNSAIYYLVDNEEEAAGFLKHLHPTKNKYAIEEKPADLIG